MTPEQLDQARAAEANRRSPDIYGFRQQLVLAARLAREGWTPPEPEVDPDLLAARVWLKANTTHCHSYVDAGSADDLQTARAYLAGATRGREGTAELAASLEGLLKYGTFHFRDRAKKALASAKRGG